MAKPADFVVDNASGSAVRTDLNNIFDAISINNGFSSGAPTQKYKYMWYADEASSGKMSFYKSNASDQIKFISLTNGNFFGPDGSLGTPSYTFENQAATGFFKSGTNVIGVQNNSVLMAEFKTDGTLIKGILDVIPASGQANFSVKTNLLNDQDSNINIVADTTYTSGGFQIKRRAGANGSTELVHRGTGDFLVDTDEAADIMFKTDSTERLTIKGAGTEEGSLISHDHDRAILSANGFAFSNSGTNGADFEALALVKKGNNLGTALFINILGNVDNNKNLLEFQYGGSAVGGIQLANNGTQISVNGQASDYRLKENVVALSDGITRLKAMKPIRYNYKTYKEGTVDGFLAHELSEIVPNSVSGTKDEVDGDGKAKYQFIDTSKLVPLVVGALQEAIAKIETLETKVAALEGS
tara:strand:+ start:2823 stop:4061 length:1239 start_codon:yes stop_codon:yes gene_type:complete